MLHGNLTGRTRAYPVSAIRTIKGPSWGGVSVESQTKRKLSADELEQAIARCFGPVRITTAHELTAGWCNTAYDLMLDDDQRVVLKVSSSPAVRRMRCERAMMAAEVAALQRFAHTEVPVPRVSLFDQTGEIIDSDYFIMQHLPGTPYNQIKAALSQSQQDLIEFQIGRVNRVINACRGDSFGYYAQERHRSCSWSQTFYGLVEDVLADASDAAVELPVAVDQIDREVRRRLDCLDEVREPRLIHWDLWDGNVLIGEGRLVGILDFERVLWADPLMEYYFGRLCASPGFVRGYGLTVGTPSERGRRALYDLYFDLMLLIECAYRQYDDMGHVHWTQENFCQGWRDFIATPLA